MSTRLSEAPSLQQRQTRSRVERIAAVPSARPLSLPLAFTLLLIVLGFLPSVAELPVVRLSSWGAAGALLAWNAVMLTLVRRQHRTLVIEASVRKQHWVQACAHLSILTYWGWYWHEVY